MITLNNLSTPNSTRKNKRIGRGQGSGWGTQAGKGHKGQKARSGGGVPLGFEGGQMPIYRRLPKRGFTNHMFKNEIVEVSSDKIIKYDLQSKTISIELLAENGLIPRSLKSPIVKIIKGRNEVASQINVVEGIKFSKSLNIKVVNE